MNSPQISQPQNIAFDFVQSLAAELSAGKVDLPSFPEVAVRVRRILADPKSSISQVVRVVGSEPALAARLMRISNSASLNRSGKTIADLRTAINRIGYNMVRSAAISFAMSQIRKANKLASLKPYLDEIWQRSTQVAAFAFVLARSCSKVSADEAMLAGMMHSIGKLYVLTRASGRPDLFSDGPVLDGLLTDWHASIGKAILENWEFSDEMAGAVGSQDDHGDDEPGPATLRDVIAIATLLATYSEDLPGLEAALQNLPGASRLGLTEAKIALVLTDSAAEVKALKDALGD